MKKIKKIRALKRSWESILMYTIIISILLLSLGIYLIGIKFGSIGKSFIVAGSSLFYIATIVLAFKI